MSKSGITGLLGGIVSRVLLLPFLAAVLLPLFVVAAIVWESVDPEAGKTGVLAEVKGTVADGLDVDCNRERRRGWLRGFIC